MVNKDNTITVGELMKMLADGRVTMDMSLATWKNGVDTLQGVVSVEIQTYKDGSKVLCFFSDMGADVADIKDCVSTAEVFP
jgi:hypothetical protein